jgi:tetratricopeptide (TPR) repeat protein
LGTLAFKALRQADALDFWTKALAAAPPTRQAIYLANQARLYRAASDHVNFAATTEMALAAAETPQTPNSAKADALSLGAALALDRGRTELALSYLDQALALDRQTENAAGLAQSHELLGRALLDVERIAEAAQSLDRSFYLFAALKDSAGTNRLYELLKTASEKGYPKDLSPYRTVLKNPDSFDPIERLCP